LANLFGGFLGSIAGSLGRITSLGCGIASSFLHIAGGGFHLVARGCRSFASLVSSALGGIDSLFGCGINCFASCFHSFAGFLGGLFGFLATARGQRGKQNRGDRNFCELFHATFLPGLIPESKI
jgi:hypothetical protein